MDTPHTPPTERHNHPETSPIGEHPAGIVTSLDTLETKSHLARNEMDDPHALDSDTEFRHSGWRSARTKIRTRLERDVASPSRLTRFDECGSRAWVFQSAEKSDRFKVRASYCHDRFCKPCARAKAMTIATNLGDYLRGKTVRLITLTLKSSHDDLSDQITRIYRCFSRLRRSKFWKLHITGGAAFFEVTLSTDTKLWHPHLHIIVEGRYVPQHTLAHTWREITGDSHIVDVRAIDQQRGVAEYVCKYVGSPFPSDVYHDDDLLSEAMTAISGRRTCLTFAAWRGLKLTALPKTDEWQPVAPLNELRALAKSGDAWAIGILTACKPSLTITPDQSYAWAYEENEPYTEDP